VLSLGILAFRWVSLAWMVVLALTAGELRRPVLAVATIAGLVAWTTWLTVARPTPSWPVLAADLALAAGLNLVAGLVMPVGSVGERPYFAAGYPVAAAVTWGAARGVGGGVAAGLALGGSLVAGQLANGIDLAGEPPAVLLDLAGGTLNFVLAGGAVGLVARLLERSAGQLREATETLRARERAARLAERESLARQIHDSVLQALALVHKRGRELAAGGPVPPAEVAGLAEMAAGQERALRSLILRDPEQEATPAGAASLRAALEELAAAERPLPVTVGATGALWLPAGQVEELVAAARQALDNVVEHAGASRAALFAEEDGGEVVLTVRDDGRGFTYDERRLLAEGKIGLAKSVKGRVEQLGGSMAVTSRPGAGTEVELRVPLERHG
jgi:signal transduction histidine kinase